MPQLAFPEDVAPAVAALHEAPTRAVMLMAGAGTRGLAWLHALAGSSRTIVEAVDCYARESLLDWLGAAPSSLASPATAAAMARAARARALALGAEDAIGVGLTAAISTSRERRGENRVWVGVAGEEAVTLMGAVLQRGRERAAEEAIAARLLVGALCEAAGVAPPPTLLADDEPLQRPAEPLEGMVLGVLGGALDWLVVSDRAALPEGEVPRGLLPGSFNPLHEGHKALAAAAQEDLGAAVGFELAATNADKGLIEAGEVVRRVEAIRAATERPLVVTSVPRFVEKAALFPGRTFVVGWDTAARVLDEAYYPEDGGRDAALKRLAACGCSFLVAGRAVDGAFRDPAELRVPPAHGGLFAHIPASRFRIDVSSTELRARAANADAEDA